MADGFGHAAPRKSGRVVRGRRGAGSARHYRLHMVTKHTGALQRVCAVRAQWTHPGGEGCWKRLGNGARLAR
ncbi:hypothetical protein XOC_1430 [Xanthomonas oryzae pv. oryzicola BLS256]|uniref:Uncharacterized protein n=1 Tax=Xanthomonas oryzae pv. oryzicola (strain BLS256) TaxID=383407 RepID=G7TIY3_XANOB|nr:hypothetical protein XOC_1430 [Xanthomonas oryzae pv. oryzicola BLS256]QEO98492.1 hypothetical protein XOCgx_3503 [Xanthomonas oryzae pv. oryzicola]